MKIVIATPLYPPEVGGPAMYAKELSERFSSAGHTVVLVRFADVRRLPKLIRHVAFFWRVFREARHADAVIGFDTWSTGVPAVLAAKLAGAKSLMRIGGDFLWEAYLDRTQSPVRLSEFYATRRQLSLKERLIFIGARFVVRATDALVFNTAWQRSLWERAYGFSSSKAAVIENEYPEDRHPSSARGTVFVAAARSRFLKNARTLQTAFEEVRRAFPEAELDTRVLPPTEHEARIKDAYAVIVPSISDISPNTAVDALRYGKPCILPNDTGVRDRLGGACIFVDTLDAGALAAAMKTLLEPAGYREAEEHVRSFAFSHSWSAVTDEFLAILKELCAS